MKASAQSGLTPVTVKEDFGRYRKGMRVRLSPQEAHKFADYVTVGKITGKTIDVPVGPEMVSPRILPAALPVIPDGWEGLHRLQKVKLAEQVHGSRVDGKDVDKVIRDEVERRKAAEKA